MFLPTTADYVKKYENIPVKELGFYIPGQLYMQDAITLRDNNLVGLYGNKTLEQYREEYPTMIISSLDEIVIFVNEAGKSPVEEIDAERYDNMLEMLWPIGWNNGTDSGSFKYSEMYSGEVAYIYAFFTDASTNKRRYFTLRDLVTMPHSEIIQRCRDYAKELKVSEEGEA